MVNAMSTPFQTNLNSVSNGCTLAALKEHINTCLQRWRQKLHSSKSKKHQPTEHQQQQTQEECRCYCQHQHHSYTKWFRKASHKEFSFVQRTTVYCKTFNTKLQRFKVPQQQHQQAGKKDFFTTHNNDSKGPRKYGRKVEIVAKLLSTTLFAASTTASKEDSSQQTDTAYSSFEDQIETIKSFKASLTSTTVVNTNAMTITDLTLLELRDEYPDLDMEIRSILTARAQEGATISMIRDDYRKLTGIQFPVYENVTDFLLSIPYISAYCNEKGTRIFNIRPMEKTKHIHDMVMRQKPEPEPTYRSTNNRYYRERPRNTNYNPYNWRRNSSNRQMQEKSNKNYEEPAIISDNSKQQLGQKQQAVISTDNNLSRDESEGFVENNWYYKDNCNYLYNRICNQQNSNQPPVAKSIVNNIEKPPQTLTNPTKTSSTTSTNLNNYYNANIRTYENNINHLNNLFQLQQQQQQKHHNCEQRSQNQQIQQNLNTNNVVSKPLHRRSSPYPYKAGMPRSSRSSSPTTAKSGYTNDSVYTDSDYEAHLLDFLLLGDDFLLYLARMELKCKFKKHQRILQSGLCVSGQTIFGATKRIKALSDSRRSIILNIGSVDIMQGRQLIKIEHDFRELVLLMLKKGIRPILTTLAPLGNYNHDDEVKGTLERFNEFIKREGMKRNLVVIDIWKCLVNEKGHVFFDCYQNEPRTVTGTSESYLFWNKIGRQRVLQLIESKLEY